MILIKALDWIFTRKSNHIMHFWARLWGKLLIWTSPVWTLKTDGLENYDRKKTFVVVVNHQSMMDIFVLLAGLKLNFKFLSKKEVFSIPLIGWHMKHTGYIRLDRGSAESARAAMASAREWLKKGESIVFFPEGTRSDDGQMLPFKAGAFRLAQELEVPVLPVVIDGTGDALPKNSWRLLKLCKFRLSAGKPVLIPKDANVHESLRAIQQGMADRLEKMRS